MRLALALITSLLTISEICAQSSGGGGTIQGAVHDSSGAVVPSAKLTISNLGTGPDTHVCPYSVILEI